MKKILKNQLKMAIAGGIFCAVFLRNDLTLSVIVLIVSTFFVYARHIGFQKAFREFFSGWKSTLLSFFISPPPLLKGVKGVKKL